MPLRLSPGPLRTRPITGHLGRLDLIPLLRRAGLSAEQVQSARDEAERCRRGLAWAVSRLGLIREDELLGLLQDWYRVPALSLREVELDVDVVRLLPRELAVRARLVAVNRPPREAVLVVAMADPSDPSAVDAVAVASGLLVEVLLASEEAIDAAILEYYPLVN